MQRGHSLRKPYTKMQQIPSTSNLPTQTQSSTVQKPSTLTSKSGGNSPVPKSRKTTSAPVMTKSGESNPWQQSTKSNFNMGLWGAHKPISRDHKQGPSFYNIYKRDSNRNDQKRQYSRTCIRFLKTPDGSTCFCRCYDCLKRRSEYENEVKDGPEKRSSVNTLPLETINGPNLGDSNVSQTSLLESQEFRNHIKVQIPIQTDYLKESKTNSHSIHVKGTNSKISMGSPISDSDDNGNDSDDALSITSVETIPISPSRFASLSPSLTSDNNQYTDDEESSLLCYVGYGYQVTEVTRFKFKYEHFFDDTLSVQRDSSGVNHVSLVEVFGRLLYTELFFRVHVADILPNFSLNIQFRFISLLDTCRLKQNQKNVPKNPLNLPLVVPANILEILQTPKTIEFVLNTFMGRRKEFTLLSSPKTKKHLLNHVSKKISPLESPRRISKTVSKLSLLSPPISVGQSNINSQFPYPFSSFTYPISEPNTQQDNSITEHTMPTSLLSPTSPPLTYQQTTFNIRSTTTRKTPKFSSILNPLATQRATYSSEIKSVQCLNDVETIPFLSPMYPSLVDQQQEPSTSEFKPLSNMSSRIELHPDNLRAIIPEVMGTPIEARNRMFSRDTSEVNGINSRFAETLDPENLFRQLDTQYKKSKLYMEFLRLEGLKPPVGLKHEIPEILELGSPGKTIDLTAAPIKTEILTEVVQSQIPIFGHLDNLTYIQQERKPPVSLTFNIPEIELNCPERNVNLTKTPFLSEVIHLDSPKSVGVNDIWLEPVIKESLPLKDKQLSRNEAMTDLPGTSKLLAHRPLNKTLLNTGPELMASSSFKEMQVPIDKSTKLNGDKEVAQSIFSESMTSPITSNTIDPRLAPRPFPCNPRLRHKTQKEKYYSSKSTNDFTEYFSWKKPLRLSRFPFPSYAVYLDSPDSPDEDGVSPCRSKIAVPSNTKRIEVASRKRRSSSISQSFGKSQRLDDPISRKKIVNIPNVTADLDIETSRPISNDSLLMKNIHMPNPSIFHPPLDIVISEEPFPILNRSIREPCPIDQKERRPINPKIMKRVSKNPEFISSSQRRLMSDTCEESVTPSFLCSSKGRIFSETYKDSISQRVNRLNTHPITAIKDRGGLILLEEHCNKFLRQLNTMDKSQLSDKKIDSTKKACLETMSRLIEKTPQDSSQILSEKQKGSKRVKNAIILKPEGAKAGTRSSEAESAMNNLDNIIKNMDHLDNDQKLETMGLLWKFEIEASSRIEDPNEDPRFVKMWNLVRLKARDCLSLVRNSLYHREKLQPKDNVVELRDDNIETCMKDLKFDVTVKIKIRPNFVCRETEPNVVKTLIDNLKSAILTNIQSGSPSTYTSSKSNELSLKSSSRPNKRHKYKMRSVEKIDGEQSKTKIKTQKKKSGKKTRQSKFETVSRKSGGCSKKSKCRIVPQNSAESSWESDSNVVSRKYRKTSNSMKSECNMTSKRTLTHPELSTDVLNKSSFEPDYEDISSEDLLDEFMPNNSTDDIPDGLIIPSTIIKEESSDPKRTFEEHPLGLPLNSLKVTTPALESVTPESDTHFTSEVLNQSKPIRKRKYCSKKHKYD